MRAVVSGGRFSFQFESQPLPGIFECAPDPAAGGCVCVPCAPVTNARNRPTVTSYLSRRNALIVCWKVWVAGVSITGDIVAAEESSSWDHETIATIIVATRAARVRKGQAARCGLRRDGIGIDNGERLRLRPLLHSPPATQTPLRPSPTWKSE